MAVFLRLFYTLTPSLTHSLRLDSGLSCPVLIVVVVVGRHRIWISNKQASKSQRRRWRWEAFKASYYFLSSLENCFLKFELHLWSLLRPPLLSCLASLSSRQQHSFQFIKRFFLPRAHQQQRQMDCFCCYSQMSIAAEYNVYLTLDIFPNIIHSWNHHQQQQQPREKWIENFWLTRDSTLHTAAAASASDDKVEHFSIICFLPININNSNNNNLSLHLPIACFQH